MPVTLSSLAPQISKAEFDDEATEFLHKYYPEALTAPMAVPIDYVARHRMGLRIVERRLTEDLSILGQMCFTSGLAEIYDKDTDEYREVRVRYGTMIIDPDTVAKRNEGCKNNTIAHECFHWHKHRDYHIATSVHAQNKAIERHCEYYGKPEETQPQWTDEDWMEWQARGIAPRILMPVQTFGVMAEKYFADYLVSSDVQTKGLSMYWWIVTQLAAFFKVSKQSVEIRLEETGYHL